MRRESRAMGGERLTKHRAAGEARRSGRIDHLLDAGSFMELGTLVGGSDAPAGDRDQGQSSRSGQCSSPPRLHGEGGDHQRIVERSGIGWRSWRCSTGCR
ncbi:MAG: hypothetical protein R2695_11225 [Acidimicrobiales bacterium]